MMSLSTSNINAGAFPIILAPQILPAPCVSIISSMDAHMYTFTREVAPRSGLRFELSYDALKEWHSTPTTIVASGCDSDAQSSVSSMFSLEKEEEQRSIFRSYWKRHGQRCTKTSPFHVETMKRTIPRRVPDLDEEMSQDSNNTYERTLKEQESTTSQRRSIFGLPICLTKQISTPCFRRYPPMAYRKAVSDSELQCKRMNSCMRPAKYSQQSEIQSVAKHQQQYKVSFDGRINVVDYNLPVEVWAEDGWSKYFAL